MRPQTKENPLSNPRIPFQFSPDRPTLVAPSGGPLIVQTVVNVEFWPFDQPMPRTILPSPHGVTHTPDVPNFSWVEYGMRCGLPRLLNLLSERHVPTVASMNAAVIDAYPRAAEAIRNAEWEFMGHGVRQQTLHKATDEREVIAEALTRIQDFTGTRPRGWLGPGLQETVEPRKFSSKRKWISFAIGSSMICRLGWKQRSVRSLRCHMRSISMTVSFMPSNGTRPVNCLTA